jgi:hypothetical protein
MQKKDNKPLYFNGFRIYTVLPTNQKVVGSNPAGRAKKSLENQRFSGLFSFV